MTNFLTFQVLTKFRIQTRSFRGDEAGCIPNCLRHLWLTVVVLSQIPKSDAAAVWVAPRSASTWKQRPNIHIVEQAYPGHLGNILYHQVTVLQHGFPIHDIVMAYSLYIFNIFHFLTKRKWNGQNTSNVEHKQCCNGYIHLQWLIAKQRMINLVEMGNIEKIG